MSKKPGMIYRFEIPDEIIPKSVFCCSTHSFSIADTIELARTLGQLPQRLIVYGIEGKSFEMGEEISEEVKEASQEVLKRVVQEILV